ncbi:MAG: AmmeMemoRadiSam system protein B [Planctomycetota bacterium]
MNESNTPQPAPEAPPFDPNADHHARPRLRPSVVGRPVPVKNQEGQQATMLGLMDRNEVTDKRVVVNAIAQFILPQMNGQNSVDQILGLAKQQATNANVPANAVVKLAGEHVQQLVAQLDVAGMLEGPTFDAMLQKMHEDFDSSDVLPPASTATMADMLVMGDVGQDATDEQKKELGPQKLRETFDKSIDEALKKAENPAFDALPHAILVPHLDYPRGWRQYGAAYGRLRTTPRPDRVIILGANHFGFGTGVVGCDKAFETPLGRMDLDADFLDRLKGKLGDDNAQRLMEHRYDHEREHSIELQVPWIQHTMSEDGKTPKMCAFLIHDPSRKEGGESYDGNGLGLTPFTEALQATIAESPGLTLVIASGNLSHVGQQFGDNVKLAGDDEQGKQFQQQTAGRDQEMINLLREGKASEFIAAMAWQQNPTRWTSTGTIAAMMLAFDGAKLEVMDYGGAIDPQGTSLITAAAGVVR